MITREILVRKTARKEPRKALLYQTCTQSLLREREGTRGRIGSEMFLLSASPLFINITLLKRFLCFP